MVESTINCTYHDASQCGFEHVDFLPELHCSAGDDTSAQVAVTAQIFRSAIPTVIVIGTSGNAI